MSLKSHKTRWPPRIGLKFPSAVIDCTPAKGKVSQDVVKTTCAEAKVERCTGKYAVEKISLEIWVGFIKWAKMVNIVCV